MFENNACSLLMCLVHACKSINLKAKDYHIGRSISPMKIRNENYI